MDLDQFSEKLLQSVSVGLAVVKIDGLAPLFTNEHFRTWLQPDGGDTVDLSIVGIDLGAVAATLEPGATEVIDARVKVRRRDLSLSLHISRLAADGLELLFIEVHNSTRIAEMEVMIASYAKMVERNERELSRERERAEKLLLNIMPKQVLAELKEFGVTAPHSYDAASVLMLDFVAFTEMAIADDPAAVVSELNDIFTNFDRISEQFGCERIKTIGDAYMAVSGIPEPTPDHASNIARAALLFVRYLEQRNKAHSTTWTARIGIATGPVIGSIIGIHKYVYDIFGPAVNLATRMERRCAPMEIMLCDPMAAEIDIEFRLTAKGEEEIKGFGTRSLYSLDGAA
jgi:adenylate cyclase